MVDRLEDIGEVEKSLFGIPITEGDPWGMIGARFISRHCKGKNAEVVMYDHRGYVQAECDCGEQYVHDEGWF